jgi:hypothetical protein
MSKDNTMMVACLIGGFYLLTRNRTGAAYSSTYRRPGAVSTMPGTAGTGLQQVAAAALSGFLQTAASGIQNSAYGYTPSLWNTQQVGTDYSQSSTLQDVANDQYGNDPFAALLA